MGWPVLSLDGFDERKNVACSLRHRNVHQLAVHGGAGGAPREGFVKRLQYAGSVIDFRRGRHVNLFGGLDLRRMDYGAPANPEPFRQRGVALESFEIPDVREYAVQR